MKRSNCGREGLSPSSRGQVKGVQPAEGRTHVEETAGAAAASAKGGARHGPRTPGAEALQPVEPGAGARACAAVTGSALLVEPCVCTRAHVHRTSPPRPGQRDPQQNLLCPFQNPEDLRRHTHTRAEVGGVCSEHQLPGLQKVRWI